MMQTMKRIVSLMALGGIVGAVIVTVVAPSLVTWYSAPGGTAQAFCNCAEVARSTARTVVGAQLVGLGVGAVFGGTIGILLRPRRSTTESKNAPDSVHAESKNT